MSASEKAAQRMLGRFAECMRGLGPPRGLITNPLPRRRGCGVIGATVTVAGVIKAVAAGMAPTLPEDRNE
jgi:hypothetical protein